MLFKILIFGEKKDIPFNEKQNILIYFVKHNFTIYFVKQNIIYCEGKTTALSKALASAKVEHSLCGQEEEEEREFWN